MTGLQTVRLTMAQALVRYLNNQHIEEADGTIPFVAGVWAIFGHGNVAGLGEALYDARDQIDTLRAHNEQGMAHAAIAFAKTHKRRRIMACTTSIGPGATNMVTAAALAHVNRLPVLFLPGDVFANRRPDPVLQQLEDFGDGTASVNDCFRPVSRYFDRITRPEQIIAALPRAMMTLTDPVDCGPVTLSLCQDVQAEAYDYPVDFFKPRVWKVRAPEPSTRDISDLAAMIAKAERPLAIVGGGVAYAGAQQRLTDFIEATGIPMAETQAGKGIVPWGHPQNLGSVGVTGTEAANRLAANADLIIGLGTRLQDFTTGSRALFEKADRKLVQVNVAPYDAFKHNAYAIVGDVDIVLDRLLDNALGAYSVSADWRDMAADGLKDWNRVLDSITALPDNVEGLPTDAQVVGATNRTMPENAIVVCAAGGLPGELHKFWRTGMSGGYHLEYGYSCMGYEIAGGVGVKLAAPERHVVVMVGDGSYLMMNSEIATAVALGLKLTIVVLDNRGFGCINRLQQGVGGAGFNNLLKDCPNADPPHIDFAAHAAAMGAVAEKVDTITALEKALERAVDADGVHVVVIDTDPLASAEQGGAWWDVPVAEISNRSEVRIARQSYEEACDTQQVDG